LHIKEVRAGFKGELWTQEKKAALEYGLFHIPGESADGLGKDRIHFGGNSGYQAINLAYLFGAVRIVLLGFDMQYKGGLVHWHGDHPMAINRECPVRSFVKKFPRLADDLKSEGVEVLNATRETALDCFQKIGIEDL
jgi:hypothetical protein